MPFYVFQYRTTLDLENDDNVYHGVHSLVVAEAAGAIHPENKGPPPPPPFISLCNSVVGKIKWRVYSQKNSNVAL